MTKVTLNYDYDIEVLGDLGHTNQWSKEKKVQLQNV